MNYQLNVLKETKKHIFCSINDEHSDSKEEIKAKVQQLMYEVGLVRRIQSKYIFPQEYNQPYYQFETDLPVYKIAKSRWDKFKSYVRGVNKLQRFRY